jgi:hypothetical protein
MRFTVVCSMYESLWALARRNATNEWQERGESALSHNRWENSNVNDQLDSSERLNNIAQNKAAKTVDGLVSRVPSKTSLNLLGPAMPQM